MEQRFEELIEKVSKNWWDVDWWREAWDNAHLIRRTTRKERREEILQTLEEYIELLQTQLYRTLSVNRYITLPSKMNEWE